MTSSARGRPRVQESADDIVAGVLVAAGARVSTADYTTRRIAGLTGLSQTLVSRAIRRIRGSDTRPSVPAAQIGAGLRLAQFRVQYPQISLRFEAAQAQESTQPRGFHRRCAAVMAALWVSGAAEWPPPETDDDAGSPAVECAGTDETPHQNRGVSEVPGTLTRPHSGSPGRAPGQTSSPRSPGCLISAARAWTRCPATCCTSSRHGRGGVCTGSPGTAAAPNSTGPVRTEPHQILTHSRWGWLSSRLLEQLRRTPLSPE